MFDMNELKKLAEVVGEIVTPEERERLGYDSVDSSPLVKKAERLVEADMISYGNVGSVNHAPLARLQDKKTLFPWQGKESDAEIAFRFEDVMDAQGLYDFVVNTGLLVPGEIKMEVSEHQVSVHFASHVLVMKPEVIQAAMLAYYDHVEDTPENDEAFESLVDMVEDVLQERVKVSGAPKKRSKGNPFHDRDTGEFTGASSSIDSKKGGSWSDGKAKLKYTGSKKSKKGDTVVNFGSTKHPCGRAARKKGKDIRCWDGKPGKGIVKVMKKRIRKEHITDDDLRGMISEIDRINEAAALIEASLREDVDLEEAEFERHELVYNEFGPAQEKGMKLKKKGAKNIKLDKKKGKWNLSFSLPAGVKVEDVELIERFGSRGRRYSGDPHWIKAKYAGTDANGKPFKKGQKVFYYPNTKTVLTGKEAEAAAREFEAAAADEYTMSGRYEDVELDESQMVPGSVEHFLFVLSSKAIQADKRQEKADIKRGIPVNIYRLGHYLKAIDTIRDKAKGILKSTEKSDLSKLKALISRGFTPDFSPAKFVNKAIDTFVQTGKAPKISGKGGTKPPWNEDVGSEGDELTEAFKVGPNCKKVIASFLDKKPMEGKKLYTDGKRLDGLWMGGNGIAQWEKGKIYFTDLGSKAADTVQRAVRKAAPKNWLGEDVGLREAGSSKPKSMYDKIPEKYRPFGWATPAKNIDGSVPEPWRVFYTDRALLGLERLFPRIADSMGIWVDSYGVRPRRGKEQIQVGLRNNRDKGNYNAALKEIADGLKGKYKVFLSKKTVVMGQHELFLVDDLDRNILKMEDKEDVELGEADQAMRFDDADVRKANKDTEKYLARRLKKIAQASGKRLEQLTSPESYSFHERKASETPSGMKKYELRYLGSGIADAYGDRGLKMLKQHIQDCAKIQGKTEDVELGEAVEGVPLEESDYYRKRIYYMLDYDSEKVARKEAKEAGFTLNRFKRRSSENQQELPIREWVNPDGKAVRIEVNSSDKGYYISLVAGVLKKDGTRSHDPFDEVYLVKTVDIGEDDIYRGSVPWKKMRVAKKKMKESAGGIGGSVLSEAYFDDGIGVFGGEEHKWPEINVGDWEGPTPEGAIGKYGDCDHIRYNNYGDGSEVDLDANSWIGSSGEKPVKYVITAYGSKKSGTIDSPSKSEISKLIDTADKLAKQNKKKFFSKIPKVQGWEMLDESYMDSFSYNMRLDDKFDGASVEAVFIAAGDVANGHSGDGHVRFVADQDVEAVGEKQYSFKWKKLGDVGGILKKAKAFGAKEYEKYFGKKSSKLESAEDDESLIETVYDVLDVRSIGNESGEAQKLVSRIKKEIEKSMPPGVVLVAEVQSRLGEKYIYIATGLEKDLKKVAHGIRQNDPAFQKFFVNGVKEDDSLAEKLEATIVQGGGLRIKPDPDDRYSLGRSAKFGWRKKKGTPDQIVKHFGNYFKKVKKVIQDNKGMIEGRG